VTATAADIRAGITAALTAIPDMQASPYVLANPTPPSAHVMRGEIEYDQAMQGGTHTWTMRVQAFVALTSDIGSATILDKFLAVDGIYSVKAAIEADRTLGGVIQDLHVTSATGETIYPRDQGGPVLGSEWTVEVWL
jgi:hypothetical protein